MKMMVRRTDSGRAGAATLADAEDVRASLFEGFMPVIIDSVPVIPLTPAH
jgi:hypothetical protein